MISTRRVRFAVVARRYACNFVMAAAALLPGGLLRAETATTQRDENAPAVFCDSGDAGRIIFVCDTCGSMVNKMAALKAELERTIGRLRPNQSFNVIFLQHEGCAALDKTKLLAANSDNKRDARVFIDFVTADGITDPIPGLTLALEQHPQLVYLVTDGDFVDNKAVNDTIAKLNKDRGAKINTIGYANKKDTDADFLILLKQIATDNGGTFTRVSEVELKE